MKKLLPIILLVFLSTSADIYGFRTGKSFITFSYGTKHINKEGYYSDENIQIAGMTSSFTGAQYGYFISENLKFNVSGKYVFLDTNVPVNSLSSTDRKIKLGDLLLGIQIYPTYNPHFPFNPYLRFDGGLAVLYDSENISYYGLTTWSGEIKKSELVQFSTAMRIGGGIDFKLYKNFTTGAEFAFVNMPNFDKNCGDMINAGGYEYVLTLNYSF